MNDVVFVELPETATMLETGTPQAIALRKENVVESELKAIERYRGLTIAGVDDVQGIKLVSDARKYCKKLRTTAERICKEGREGAIKEQKLWLTVEKYVVGRVSVVEKELVMEEERIETLREAQKREAVRLAKVEDDRLQGICNEFAQLGVMKAKDEIRSMEPGTLEALLSEARREKAEKEAAVKREAEARDAEVKRLRDEKLVVEEQAAAMRLRIAELEAQLNPTVTVPAPMMDAEPQECIAKIETPVVLSHPLANDKPSLPALPKLPAVPLHGNGSGNNGTISPPALLHDNSTVSRTDREAILIGQDKAALKSFALQVDVLKKYLPMCGSKKAAGLNEVIAGQIIKFSLFITKKSEEL